VPAWAWRKKAVMHREQPGLRVAYRGEPGAYAEQCLLTVFGAETIPVPQFTFCGVVEAVAAGSVHAGVLPVETSTTGTIVGTQALLQRPDLAVIGDVWFDVRYLLLGLPGQTLSQIRQVLSHPQALAQCAEFLRSLPVQLVPTADAAGSARLIWERGWTGVAAIASQRAAEVYGLTVLAADIQTRAGHQTHFLLLAAAQAPVRARAQRGPLVLAGSSHPAARLALAQAGDRLGPPNTGRSAHGR
jgi:prephenate dehydratase